MAKKNFAERYETKIAEELQRKGVGKKKEIANKYGCDIGQIMSIAKKYGIDSTKEETKEVKTELTIMEKVELAKALLDTRGNVQLAISTTGLDKDLCVKAAETFYHPKYVNLPDQINYETVKFKTLIAIMVLNFKKREDIYEILKNGDSLICESFLAGITSSHIASAIFNLKQDDLIDQEYLPGIKKSPTIRISQMTSEQFLMVAEAVDNNMSVTDIADMLGCSTGMVYDVFRTKVYQNAKRRYEKHKVKPVETKSEPMVEHVVNGPAAHEAPTDSPTTLEELNNKYRALETAYSSKLTELQQIKNDMDKTKEEIKKLQEKEDILKKVEELERQKKMLMEQLQTL